MPTAALIDLEPGPGSPTRPSSADIHRLACYLVEDLGQEAHRSQVKSFAAWPMVPITDGRRRCFRWRLNSLDDTQGFADRVRTRLAARPEIGRGAPAEVLAVSFERTSAHEIAASTPSAAVDVAFISPFRFSRNGRNYPLPDPVLLHDRLVQRWNTITAADHPRLLIADDVHKSLLSAVEISTYDLRATIEPERLGKVSACGTASFVLRDRSLELRTVFAAMWRFAEFAGIGSETAHSRGAVAVTGFR
jgi:CRISPR-associated endoribonuclease Cas6